MRESTALTAGHGAHRSTTLLWIGQLETLFYEFYPLDVSSFHVVKRGMGNSCEKSLNCSGLLPKAGAKTVIVWNDISALLSSGCS